MENFHVGFCINCGHSIDWDVNTPFCKSCKSKQKSICIEAKNDFNYCHGCGCLSKKITIDNPLCREKCSPFDRDSNLIDNIYLDRLDRYKQFKKFHTIWDCSPVLDAKLIDEYNIYDLLQIVVHSGLKINDVFDNDVSSNKRIMNILWRWESGLPISLPILESDMNRFNNGRHRVLAAYYLKEEKIPIYCKK